MTDSNEQINKIKIAAIADLHVERQPTEVSYIETFERASKEADLIVLCGDLTTLGKADQAEFLAEQLKHATIPVVAVLGNHDYESGEEERINEILQASGITVLDGNSHVVRGIGIAGTKGFGGGFAGKMLAPFGETGIKNFAKEGERERLKLEKALQSLDTDRKIVILHYSPVRDTVVGEDPEIFPFLGSSRLEEAINNFDVTAVFHGHAHHGTILGKTRNDVPVYNVAVPLLRRENLLYKIVEI